jgi:tripartite-type tricarboxylate transporter receptor subunit TctC
MRAAVRALGFAAAVTASLTGHSQLVSAESYPAHPVRMIVPFAAAGPTDVIARIVAQKLSDAWGQQVYIENLPGAGGNTGIVNAARSKPDGRPPTSYPPIRASQPRHSTS